VQHGPQVSFDYKRRPQFPSHHGRWFMSGLLLPLVGGTLAYLFAAHPPALLSERALTAPALLPSDLPPIEPVVVVHEPLRDKVEITVRRNDTLDRWFRQLELNLDDLANMRSLPGARESIDRLRVGDTITVVHEQGAVHSFSRRVSETEILSITRSASGFQAETIATPVETKVISTHGTIDTSLFVAARAAGVSSELIMRLANDIFGWKIDFALEIQPGDRFDIVYEQKYRDGRYIGDGRILAADFTNEGTLHRAVYYASSDGQIADYFAPDGRSMRRQFLRAPLDFTRISSNFSPRRRHPLLNTIRAHKGVDYAAPTGTVIKAAGEGRVDFVGTKGGYGKVVILEHGGGISTLYGHMSRFAAPLRNGQRVRQGDTIGYVGSTGAATGPHLHYEYRLNGAHKNPRTVSLPDAAPIPQGYMAEFQLRSGSLLSQLDRARDAAVAAVPGD
jgi:murein DD-endopeptidase MepM/ murein hydrolase activator NlpD